VPLIAVVQRRKDNGWVLPKGKLKPSESAIAAAEREVVEETGHNVSVHEFLGVVSYKATNGKPKVVQFWRMHPRGGRTRKLMRDIKAVKWLPLEAAIEKLDHPLEQLFLRNVGHRAVAALSAAPGSLEPPADAIATEETVRPPVQPTITIAEPMAAVPFARLGGATIIAQSDNHLGEPPEFIVARARTAKSAPATSSSTVLGVRPNMIGRIRQWWRLVTTTSAKTQNRPAGDLR